MWRGNLQAPPEASFGSRVLDEALRDRKVGLLPHPKKTLKAFYRLTWKQKIHHQDRQIIRKMAGFSACPGKLLQSSLFVGSLGCA